MPESDRRDLPHAISESFIEQVRDAYEHLYDLVYLRNHPLIRLLPAIESPSRHKQAWRLHELLLEMVDELDPGPHAPVFSREWRRHRVMVLRYVDGLSPEEAAERLAISLRQLYRELATAIQAVATVIWDRCKQGALADQPTEERDAPGVTLDRIELLRIEGARASAHTRHAHLAAIIDGLLPLLADRLAQQKLAVQLDLPPHLPAVALGQSIVRQLLLGLCGHLIARATQATLQIAGYVEGADVLLEIGIAPATQVLAPPEDVQARLEGFAEMARASGATLAPCDSTVTGFVVRLPHAPARTLLVVDDNQDSLDLFTRILQPAGYAVVPACSAQEGFALAVSLRPMAIALDLMMPEQDGWDLMHLLLGHESTRNIPIIVCSVLQQRELALSLGAIAFLRKPLDGAVLLPLLARLDEP